MESSKAAFFGLTLALSSLVALPASASGVALLAGADAAVDASSFSIVHRECPPFCSQYTQSPLLHLVDDDDGKKYKKHRKHRRRPNIHFGWYGGFYDPFYYRPYYHRPYYYDPFYDPFYYDPYYYPRYYDLPVHSKRLSCDKARKRVRQNGYRDVRALDCSGKTYAFSAVKGNKRYKIKVSARNGGIISRTRY